MPNKSDQFLFKDSIFESRKWKRTGREVMEDTENFCLVSVCGKLIHSVLCVVWIDANFLAVEFSLLVYLNLTAKEVEEY